MRKATYIALAVVTFSLVGCGGGGGGRTTLPTSSPTPSSPGPVGTTSKPGIMSISMLPRLDPYPTTVAQYITVAQEAFDLSFNAGARGDFMSFTWKTLEPNAGAFNSTKLSELNDGITNAPDHSMTVLLGLQVLNTTAREMPADLATAAFDSATVRTRFRALLDRVITPNRGKITYLSIGNEVDPYLRAHPTEWSRYKTFFDDVAQYARSLDPALKVGVTGTASGALIESPTELASLNATSDVVILTYYPLQFATNGAVSVRDPSVVSSDFPLMLTFAGNKQVVLQEVGYPASPLNNSSEAKQAAFIANTFSAWRDSQQRIAFLNFFVLHDFTQQMCDEFGVYYGAPTPSFEAYLCTLGLRTVNGTPRAAWSTLVSEASQANLP